MFQKITDSFKRLVAFIQSILSERNGTGSASRTIGVLVAVAGIGVLIAHVAMRHELPSRDQMTGLGLLIASGSGAYVANQAKAGATGDAANSQPAPDNNPGGGDGNQ